MHELGSLGGDCSLCQGEECMMVSGLVSISPTNSVINVSHFMINSILEYRISANRRRPRIDAAAMHMNKKYDVIDTRAQ